MKPMIPYSMQVSMALLTGDRNKANEIMATALGEIAQRVFSLAGEYVAPDIVFVIAAMKILTDSITPTLDESSQRVIQQLVENTTCITMNVETLRQMMDNGRDQEP